MNDKQETEKTSLPALLLAVQNGDEMAFSQLLVRYEPLIRRCVSHLGVDMNREDKEDMRQEAIAAFYESICRYRLDQTGVEFGLYARICINNRLISHLRRNKGKKERIVPLDDVLAEALRVQDGEDLSAGIVEEEEAKALFQLIRDNLSPFEYDVFCRYMDGNITL